MSRLRIVLMFLVSIFFLPALAKEPSISHIKKAVRSYNGQIRSYKSKKGRVRSANKLKQYVSTLTTKDRKNKFAYLFKLQDAYSSVKTANLTSKSCRFMRSELRFKFGYVPSTPRKKIRYPERYALDTINHICH